MLEVRRQLDRSLAGLAGVDREITSAGVENFDSTRWASATFEGHRHRFVVRFDGLERDVDVTATHFQRTICGDDIRLRGELLADMALVGEDHVAQPGGIVARRLHFEALTVTD